DAMAKTLEEHQASIIEANKLDIEAGKKKGLSAALIDRLTLHDKRIKDIANSLRELIGLKDPIGEIIAEWKRPNGLNIKKVRVPFGVIGIIYEARPNVTVDAIGLCIKTGNAVILRGGSDAIHSNKKMVELMSQTAYAHGIPKDSIQFVESTDREMINEMLTAKEYIDLIIPRGGAGLIKMVVENSIIPAIETGTGNCHVYVDGSADLDMAEKIVVNAKCQRPSVCNATETLLVDKKIANDFVPRIIKALLNRGVEIHGDESFQKADGCVIAATEADWETEYLDLIIAAKVVSGLDEAIAHINKYGSKHTEAIITSDKSKAQKFSEEVDASTIMVNASTRFTDGGEFGFGCEIGISTQKLHARGPMGLAEITTYKYLVEGNGQVRQ
ncbi:MAG: glutamate-5-semialdehyde dehydrogenase, partial [bacterium]